MKVSWPFGAVCLPKISSAQVEVAIRFRRRPDELVALPKPARCGMMIGCATPTGLPERDERVRVTTAASGERPRQGRRDPGATPPDHGPAAATGHEPAAILPRRPGRSWPPLLHRLPREVLGRFRLLIRPDTVLRWHRDLLTRRH